MSRASELLELAPQTLSSQLAALEASLGQPLFRREKRSLLLTEYGRWVFQYAEQIFALTQELESSLEQYNHQGPLKLSIGISASIHKLIAYQLIEPIYQLERPLQLRCHTGQVDDLFRGLKKQEYDLLLTDSLPLSFNQSGLTAHHLLDSPISLFATASLVEELKDDFPASLQGRPLLANSMTTPYFASLMDWFQQQQVHPRVVAEIDDSALIKVFGSQGRGIFAAPQAIADEVCRQYQVTSLATIDEVHDSLFALTRTRQPRHLAIRALLEKQ